jgi:hypothetical protein
MRRFIRTLNRTSLAQSSKKCCASSFFAEITLETFLGDPRKPGTLHHFNSDGSKNDYEKAVSAIGSILAKYDSDKKFPVWGFGAKYGGIVRHCFQCGPASEVDGVEGILSAYRGVFATGLIMSGPTVFTEVIQTAAAHAISLEVSFSPIDVSLTI